MESKELESNELKTSESESKILEPKDLEAVIEAILFTLGDSVQISKIALAIEQDECIIKETISNMIARYQDDNRGIMIMELDGAVQMCTKPSMYEYITRITHIPKKHVLTDVLLETLSIIAYKQPITKPEIELIRGVKSDHAVNKLVEYNLVSEIGRLDAPGRPLLFGTTEEFLRSFGVKSLEELPIISSKQIDDFRTEIEEEYPDNEMTTDEEAISEELIED